MVACIVTGAPRVGDVAPSCDVGRVRRVLHDVGDSVTFTYRCRYCQAPMHVSTAVIEENPFCAGCLHERVARRHLSAPEQQQDNGKHKETKDHEDDCLDTATPALRGELVRHRTRMEPLVHFRWRPMSLGNVRPALIGLARGTGAAGFTRGRMIWYEVTGRGSGEKLDGLHVANVECPYGQMTTLCASRSRRRSW